MVVGTANSSDYTAWYRENGTMTSLASTLTSLCSSTGHGTYASSYATGVNSSGQIVGYYVNGGGSDIGYAYTLGGGAVNIVGSASLYGQLNANSVSSNGQLFASSTSTTDYEYLCYANGVTGATSDHQRLPVERRRHQRQRLDLRRRQRQRRQREHL